MYSDKYDIVIGVDPGLTGAICVFEELDGVPKIYDMPTKKIPNPNKKVKSKFKKIPDIEELSLIFKEYEDKNVLVCIEKVHSMKQQGNVSMFNFGFGYGIYLGIIVSMGFDLVEVSPQRWKKSFPELISDEIKEYKEENKKLREISKKLKDATEKSDNKKKIDKNNLLVKKEAKMMSRKIVAEMYPSIKDMFKNVCHDGRSDAVLICLYSVKEYCKGDINEKD
jgi:hypothetical protein